MSGVSVVPDTNGVQTDAPMPPERPVPASSPLAHLREQAEKSKQRLFKHEVPGDYDPPLVVVYAMYDNDVLEPIQTRYKKLPEHLRDFPITCDVLVTSCRGVFSKMDGKLVSTETSHMEGNKIVGQPLTLESPELAEILGMPGAEPKQVLAKLYPGDGHILDAGFALARFSGYAGDEMLRDLRGN